MKKHYAKLALICISIFSFSQIQPYQWAGTIGNSFGSYVYDCVSDNSGNMFVSGAIDAGTADMDPGAGSAPLTFGSHAGFVAKYSSTGTYQWAFKLGLEVYGITLATNGDVIVCGGYSGGNNDFDPTVGTYPLPTGGGADAFVARYTSAGTLAWAFPISASSQQYMWDVCVDASGNIFASCMFDGTVVCNSTSYVCAGTEDILVIKLDGSGNATNAWQIAGLNAQEGLSITADAFGHVVLTGYTNGTADFDPSGVTYNLTTPVSAFDMFVASYDTTGTFNWAFNIDSGTHIQGFSIDNDASGNIYVTGYSEDTADFDPGSGVTTLGADNTDDGFLASYDSSGNFRWAFLIGSSGMTDRAQDITVDDADNVYVTGYFTGMTDFDPSPAYDTIRTPLNGNATACFVVKYSSAGNHDWAFSICPTTSLGAQAQGFAIDINQAGNFYLAGFIGNDADYDPVGTAVVLQGNHNVFVARYGNGVMTSSNAIEHEENQISVFPNPFADELTIQNPGDREMQITIYSADGRVVRSEKRNGRNIRLNAESLSSGSYLMEIVTEGRSEKYLLIK